MFPLLLLELFLSLFWFGFFLGTCLFACGLFWLVAGFCSCFSTFLAILSLRASVLASVVTFFGDAFLGKGLRWGCFSCFSTILSLVGSEIIVGIISGVSTALVAFSGAEVLVTRFLLGFSVFGFTSVFVEVEIEVSFRY